MKYAQVALAVLAHSSGCPMASGHIDSRSLQLAVEANTAVPRMEAVVFV